MGCERNRSFLETNDSAVTFVNGRILLIEKIRHKKAIFSGDTEGVSSTNKAKAKNVSRLTRE